MRHQHFICIIWLVIVEAAIAEEQWEGSSSAPDQEIEEGSAPSFYSQLSGENAVPEQPTLRQVLESMKPPSLMDDEYSPGSVWLHSKAGPDMADLENSPDDDEEEEEEEEDEELQSSGQDTQDTSPQIMVEGMLQTGSAPAENVTANNATSKLCNCLPLNRTESELTVKLVNESALSDALQPDAGVRSRGQPARCLLVLFYGSTCPFSAAAAPHMNALPRAFADLPVLALDALDNPGLNTRFGIIAVPTLILFHNGRPQARFNQSEPTLERVAEFVTSHTQLAAGGPLSVTSSDFSGPLSAAVVRRTDWHLLSAWLFIAACAAYAATRLRLWRRAADNVRNWWIEAEQHLHEE